jgi:hypothetical protein
MSAQLRYHYQHVNVDALEDDAFYALWEELQYCRKVEQGWHEEALRTVLGELLGAN